MKKILPLVAFSLLILASCNTVQEPILTPEQANISSQKKAITSAEDAIKQFASAYEQVQDFTGIVTISDSKDGDPQNATVGDSKFFFKKNRNEKAEITKSNDPQKQGTMLVYKGGDKVQVLLAKAIPFLGKKFTLPVNDKRIGTSRGVAFDQLDLTAMLSRFTKAGVALTLLPSKDPQVTKVSGKGTFKGIDSEVTEEILTLDNATLLPLQDEVFVKTKTVLKINVADLKINVGLTDDVFTLPD